MQEKSLPASLNLNLEKFDVSWYSILVYRIFKILEEVLNNSLEKQNLYVQFGKKTLKILFL